MQKIFGKLFLPLAWTILIEVLLCLPLQSFPVSGAFKIPHLDKFVHVIIFGVFVALWCLYYSFKEPDRQKRSLIFFYIFLVAMINGIVIEYVQLYFIPNRSFDQGDIIADIISAGIAYGICNVKLSTDRWKTFPNK